MICECHIEVVISRYYHHDKDQDLLQIQSYKLLVKKLCIIVPFLLNRLKINKISTNIDQLINQNLTNFISLDHEKGIVIEADIKTKKNTLVHCDTNRIDQVFGNLIINSIDFVPSKNGKITLRAEYSDESI